MDKKWRRTDDIFGHAINFTHICSSCGHDKFIFHCSQIIPERNRSYGMPQAGNIMIFKCEKCLLMDRFFINDTREYMQEILKLRGGESLYLPEEEK